MIVIFHDIQIREQRILNLRKLTCFSRKRFSVIFGHKVCEYLRNSCKSRNRL